MFPIKQPPALNTVHLWPVTLTKGLLMTAEDYWPLLNQREQTRASRFYQPLHRQRFIVAHGLLRFILSSYLSQRPSQEILLDYTAYGKPYLVTPPLATTLQFNFSHSAENILYAISAQQQPVGVDIEKRRPIDPCGIAKRYFSATEYQALLAMPEALREKTFYQLWTKKEALVKATGTGLHTDLSEWTVSTHAEDIIHAEQATWQITALETSPDYQAALAIAINSATDSGAVKLRIQYCQLAHAP